MKPDDAPGVSCKRKDVLRLQLDEYKCWAEPLTVGFERSARFLNALKVFDIVLAMTNGQWQSQVLANLMFDWMFRGGGDFGRGAAIAVVIMVMVIPIMIWNIRNARREMEGR